MNLYEASRREAILKRDLGKNSRLEAGIVGILPVRNVQKFPMYRFGVGAVLQASDGRAKSI